MSASGTARAEISLGKKLAFASLTLLAAMAALEGLARLVVAPRDARIHREHENMITVLGLPSLNATMEFDPQLFWKLRDGLDDQRVEGEVRGTPMSFRVSTRNSLRSPPIRSSRPELRVVALGDSCTFGLGVDDDATWPAQLEAQLRRRGVDAEVINAGVPGYTAFQGLQWLEAKGLAMQPDVLIVVFGFNDRDYWSSRSDFETARLLDLSSWQRVAARSRLYTGLRRLWIATPDEGAAPSGERGAVEASAVASAEPEPNAVPRLAPQEFVEVLSTIASRAQAEGIEVVFSTWPYRAQLDAGVRQTILYQRLVEEVAQRSGVRLVNLVDPFLDEGGALFVDHVHASAAGNGVAAKALLPAVLGD